MSQNLVSQNDYDTAAIRKLLTEAFDDEELIIFCFDHFEEVSQKFATGMTPITKVQYLVDYCKRKGIFKELLQLVKELNPNKYGELGPYKKITKELIYEILLEHHKSHPNLPGMTFAELYQLIDIPLDNRKKQAELRSELFSLRMERQIKYPSSGDNLNHLIEIEPTSIKAAQNRQETIGLMPSPQFTNENITVVNEINVLEFRPITPEYLIQTDTICAYLMHRDELLEEIKEYFTQTSKRCHFIVLYGQHLVGKSTMLDRLPQILGDAYVPLLVTGQGFFNTDSLDHFIYDLAWQLSDKFNKWGKDHKPVPNLEPLHWDNFKEGKGRKAFYIYWDQLRENAGNNRQPIVMFDEIEHLLDDPDKLSPQILTFLDKFVSRPENGYFIFVGSEDILKSKNNDLNRLIAKGQSIPVGHFEEETVKSIFSRVRRHLLSCEDSALQHLMALCDGHPGVLWQMLEAIFWQRNRSLGKQGIERGDLIPIIERVLKRTQLLLPALKKPLSEDELSIVFLISRRLPSMISELDYSLDELIWTAEQDFTDLTIRPNDLRKGLIRLAEREWIEWKDRDKGLFRFKLGILPLWFSYTYVSYHEVRQ